MLRTVRSLPQRGLSTLGSGPPVSRRNRQSAIGLLRILTETHRTIGLRWQLLLPQPGRKTESGYGPRRAFSSALDPSSQPHLTLVELPISIAVILAGDILICLLSPRLLFS